MLVKAARAHQLYLHNNPTYLRALEIARAAFAPIWELTDELVFDVTETELPEVTDAVLQRDGLAARFRELDLALEVTEQVVPTLRSTIETIQ